MTSMKKYRVRLTTDEQRELKALVLPRADCAAYKQTHARILLMSDESRPDGGMTDAEISRALGVRDCQRSSGCVDGVWRRASSRR